MPIPKIIHYCWFGNNQLPEKVQKCINSWKKMCPDYEIKRWDESNYNVEKIQYTKDAYKEKKWAFVSDYARLDIIYNYGGIYLDTDVELIKSLDGLLSYEAFLSIDKEGFLINTGLGFGAQKENTTIALLRSAYDNLSFYKKDGSINFKACTFIATEQLEKFGFKKNDQNQYVLDAAILSSDYFCPLDYSTGSMNVTVNTLGIHWYEASWFTKEDKHIHKVEQQLNKALPNGLASVIGKLYRKCYRLLEYHRKGILKEKITTLLFRGKHNK